MERNKDFKHVEGEIIKFQNHMPIKLIQSNAHTYYKCSKYDSKHMEQGYTWHQIVVEHKGVITGVDGKSVILDGIFKAVDGEEIYPVGYRHHKKEDRFLVRQCQSALDKLFKKNLSIQLANSRNLNIKVQLNIASFQVGQISPHTLVATTLNKLLDHMECYNNQNGILNLTSFGNNNSFQDVTVNLGNRSVLERVCDLIFRNDDKFRKINGVKMQNNSITTLAPLKIFEGVPLKILDLRNNLLTSATRLCKDLVNIKADDLFLAGNPLTIVSTYPESLQSIKKNFLHLDNIPVENLSNVYTPLDKEIDVSNDGHRINWSNKSDLAKYRNSVYWHAVMIPDPEHAYDKTYIIGYFFMTTSPAFCDIYPCYYKYAKGEHQFLVRDCFEQLQYLALDCNLEIKIPTIIATDELNTNVQYEKSINYYLLMNVSPYKSGQIDFASALEKALNRRYRIMDRLLDLNDFQKAEGLENIIINMSSPKILGRVLAIAARKVLSNCVELRLCNNQIITANLSRILLLMENLKAIDLGHNWITDINEIKDLSKLNLISLRLDGNPLCRKYSCAGEYIKAIKAEFPTITRLDNKDISNKNNLCTQKNYICAVEGYDFVEQFITRYFKLYESIERKRLAEIYHPNAILTLTCDLPPGHQNAYKRERLSKYAAHSRNLLAERCKIHIGQAQIMKVLVDLPPVEHDMLSFTTDTVVFNKHMVKLVVSGVLKDKGLTIMDGDMILAFSRVFILKQTKENIGPLRCGNIYKITNEFFHLSNATTTQQKNAFKYFITPKLEKPDPNDRDKEAMLLLLQEITSLKTIWCTRCLEDANWDFKKSLIVFEKLCSKNEIPNSAYN